LPPARISIIQVFEFVHANTDAPASLGKLKMGIFGLAKLTGCRA
jgi:hypothetical protein